MAHVRVLYCPVCSGDDQRAASLVAELNGTGHTAEMERGQKNQYDVLVDDKLVFSKEREGRWPTLDEILTALP